jgi:hypothetical protein
MGKLSNAQAHVIDLLNQDESYFVVKSTYYNYNAIYSPTLKDSGNGYMSHTVDYFTQPTFAVLEKLGLIELIEGVKYKLADKGKFKKGEA